MRCRSPPELEPSFLCRRECDLAVLSVVRDSMHSVCVAIKDTVVNQTSIQVGDLNLASDATDGIVFSQSGERVMAVEGHSVAYASKPLPAPYGVANFDLLLKTKQLQWFLDSYKLTDSLYAYENGLAENLAPCPGICLRKRGADDFYTSQCIAIWDTAASWNTNYGAAFAAYFTEYSGLAGFTAGSAAADTLIDALNADLATAVNPLKSGSAHATHGLNDRAIGDIMVITHLWMLGSVLVPNSFNDFVDGCCEVVAGLPASKLTTPKVPICPIGSHVLKQKMTVHPDGVDMIISNIKASPPSDSGTWVLSVDRRKFDASNALVDGTTEAGYPTVYLQQCATTPPTMHPLFPTEGSERCETVDAATTVAANL